VKTDLNSEWQEYHGEIMGLIYESGYFYELQVQYDSLSEQSANAPEKQWVLIKMNQKVLSTVPTDKTNTDLVSYLWVLDQFGPPLTLREAIGDDRPTIFFQDDGHFTGSTGCNRFNGTYFIDGSLIHTGSLAATKKMCPGGEGLLEQEQTIFQTLANAEKYQLDKDTLQIFDASNSRILIYKK
jgi:heat shock protein HslJ